MTPARVQRQRRAGWRLPEGAVVVSRPTIWGNPFPIDSGGKGRATYLYGRWLAGAYPGHEGLRAEILRRLPELRGKLLCCWCALEDPCHADVLIEMANKPEEAGYATP
ncbi:DUF4326 domain-containing protein [Xanthobacter autotrophicus]|uniref:DUF4326 domain-containing protein n=1 Tax=Xanthobacter autotrophicus TaxID=280 RepID=UPI003729777B